MYRLLQFSYLLLALVAGVVGVAYVLQPRAVPEIRMGLQVFSGLEPLVLAQKKGYYAANGVNVRMQRFTSLYDSKRAFADGKIDVTTMTLYDAILLADQGVLFRIVLVVDHTQGSNALVAQMNIATVKDLRGKRVGVTAGTALHFLLLAALHTNDLRETDVTIVNHPPDRLTELFQAGELDAASLVDPFLARVQGAKRGHVIFGSQELTEPITDVLVIRPDLERTHPGAAAALVRGYFQAVDFWKANEHEAVGIMAESLGLSPGEFRQALGGLVIAGKEANADAFGLGRTPGSLLRTIGNRDQILMDSGYLRQPSNLAQRLDDGYVRRTSP